VVEFKNKYNIQYDFAGHLRGRTLSNAIILLDETQNFSVSDLRTIISRIGENVKLVVMGSTKQIDNVYLNKFNNGLTFLENECKKQIEGVQVQGIKLTKVVRSPMSKWGDNF
jgi:PhoH-like ATPase